eukprot:207073-Rhodomonas_salina.3
MPRYSFPTRNCEHACWTSIVSDQTRRPRTINPNRNCGDTPHTPVVWTRHREHAPALHCAQAQHEGL